MKSLTPQTLIECAAKYNEPVLLLEIDWSGGLTGRYAQRPVSIEGADYLGVILDVSRIACSFRNPASEYEPVTVALAPEESLLEQVTASTPEGRHARVKLHFDNLDAADMVQLFSGHIEKVILLDDRIELIIEPLFKRYDHPLPELLLSASDFPHARAEDIGHPIPLVFGDVPRVPTLAAKVGHLTRLRGSILADDTTIEVDDASEFPASGTLLIEQEQVTYTGLIAAAFTGCARGANGTVAAEHLNRTEVIEHLAEHVFLVASHACKSINDVRVAGMPAEPGSYSLDGNNTTLLPGATLATITFPDRPKARRYSRASRFLETQFDETAPGNEALNPEHCYDTSLEGFPTLVAKISGAANNDTLRIRQTTDMSANASRKGEILKAFLMVEHFESAAFTDDYLSVSVGGQTFNLAKPSEEDLAGGGGEVDVDHSHSHSITGEHTHSMTVKKEALFTNIVVQTGGTTGSWAELNDIAGDNLNRSGFTTSADTDRSLQCRLAATTVKGAVQRIQFCCRRGESGMNGSFVLRFYLNGSLKKQYTVSGTSIPETWKSDWETIPEVVWDDLDNDNTYMTVTPLGTGIIRLFGVWFELEYLEQPANYQGAGTKDSSDVSPYSAVNHHVINEEPLSSTSLAEAVDVTEMVAGDWDWFTGREISVDYHVVGANDGVFGYILHVFFEIEYAPVEEIVSDEVTCSVRGIDTIGDGSGELIENPSDVIKHILVNMLGLGEAELLDSASFAEARALLAASGARFAFSIRERVETAGLLHALAEQARCRLAFTEKFRLKYRADTLEESVRSIAPPSILSGSARLTHAGVTAVQNALVGYHSRDYTRQGAGKYAGIVQAADSASQAQYGIRSKLLELFALRDHVYAQSLLDFMLGSNSVPVRRYGWTSFLRDLNLERGDVVEVTDLEKGLLKVKAEIIEAAFTPGRIPQMYAPTAEGLSYGRPALRGILRPYGESILSSGMYGRTAVRPYNTGSPPCELDTLQFAAALEPFENYWSAAGGTFIKLDEQNFYFVIRGKLLGRLCIDGNLYIKGFVITEQSLPATPASPLSFDTAREALAFALPDGTRVMEIDSAGNALLPQTLLTDQALVFAGTPDAIEAGASAVWFNIGSTRAAEITSEGNLRLSGAVFTDSNWEELHG